MEQKRSLKFQKVHKLEVNLELDKKDLAESIVILVPVAFKTPVDASIVKPVPTLIPPRVEAEAIGKESTAIS